MALRAKAASGEEARSEHTAGNQRTQGLGKRVGGIPVMAFGREWDMGGWVLEPATVVFRLTSHKQHKNRE